MTFEHVVRVAREKRELRNMAVNNMYARWAFKLGLVLSWFATCSVAQSAAPSLSPTNIFAPASTPANTIYGLSIFVLAVTGAIFIVVFSLLAYAVVKFRKRT